MTRKNILFAVAFVVLMSLVTVDCDRTRQKIYYEVDDADYAMCFRRLNLTHEIGCSSNRSGNVGVLQYLESRENVTWLINNGQNSPYIVLLTPQLFDKGIVDELAGSGKVNGLLVIHANLTDYILPDSFSPDTSCPNEGFSMYAENSTYGHCRNISWNPHGNGMAYNDYPFPIAILRNITHIDFIINECYRKFNDPFNGLDKSYPLCAAQVKSSMDAAKDTPTCVRRSNMVTNLNPQVYCDPLGDFNVFSFVAPINSTEPPANQSVTVVAAKLDSFSMFYSVDPAADSSIAGFITLLATIEALGKVKKELADHVVERPLLFTFFNGEVWDYIGSSRLLYEMEHGFFPGFLENGSTGAARIYPHHIRNFIEVSQVGIPEDGSLWLHTDPLSNRDPDVKQKTKDLMSDFQSAGAAAGVDISEAPEYQPLPPASFQSFLKKYAIPGFVIADHKKQFQNKYYNSRYDTHDTISMVYPDGLPQNETYDYVTDGAKHLTKVATALARTVFNLTTGSTEGADEIQADNSTITHMLYCFLIHPQCELFNFSLNTVNAKILKKNNGTGPLSTYVQVSVANSLGAPNWITMLAHNLVSYFLGDEVHIKDCSSPSDCEDKCEKLNDPKKHPESLLYRYNWIQGPVKPNSTTSERAGLCLKSTANYSIARSPAFDIKNYDWNSNEYSVWTESRWATDSMKLRVFLLPEKSYEIAILCSGIALALISFFVAFGISKKADIVFNLQNAQSS